MIYNDLTTAYSQIETLIASGDPAINEKLSNLATYIRDNGQAIQEDLMKHRDHLPLIQKMGRIESIHNACALLELKVLLNGDDDAKLAEWVLNNKDGVSSVLFDDLSKARERLLSAKLLVPDVGTALSNIVTFGLGLKGQKNVEQVRTANSSVEALAHWINSEKIPLKSVGLSPSELKAIAPYLHYVDCTDFALDDPQTFITSCCNAYRLFVSGTRIVELKQLPPQLQTLDCILCKKLTAIDLSNSKELLSFQCSLAPIATLDISHNPLLQSLNCNHSLISTLNLSQNPQLKMLDCAYCKNLTALDTSHNAQLQKLDCSHTPILALNTSKNLQLQTLNCNETPIIALDLSNNQQLQVLGCSGRQIPALDLSNNPQLQKLNCNCCPISTLDLSNNPQLKELYCSDCPNLETFNLSNNPKLQYFHCSNCPRLKSLDLSHNTQLETLSCTKCLNLEALDLSNNLQLERLYCSKCPIFALDLSNNLKLKFITCNNCPNLTTLGPSLSNTLEQLECGECPNLAQLPQVPPTAAIYSGSSLCGDLETFNVNPTDLESKPKQVLLDLGKILLQNRQMPNIVYIDPATGKPTEGVDYGGLRRQLVATLCENLFKEGSNFSFVKEGDYTMPTLGDSDSLRTFGRLLGLGIPTGTNLHPSFFYALFALSDEELESPLSESLQEKLYMARHGLMDCEKQEVAEESNLLAAIATVAKELHTLLGHRFRELGQNIPEFMIHVQGSKVTKENLKESTACDDDTYKGWIDSFIDELPPDQLKHFVMLITGSYTLSGDKITFKVHPGRQYQDSSTIIHTCSKSMDLPGNFDKDLLHQELKAQLSLLKSFNAV